MNEKKKSFNVLFLCTGNSARSILAEALLNHMGANQFRGFSAGSFPKGTVNPGAIDILSKMGIPTDDFQSKSWDEFADKSAPVMDAVVTVCDNAAAEVCPVWPASPVKAHWSIPDPAAIEGTEEQIEAAFREAYDTIQECVNSLIRTIREDGDSSTLSKRLDGIDPSRG